MVRLTLPVLTSERLRLEPVGRRHLPLLVELNADPAVMEFIRGRGATLAETETEWAHRLGAGSDAGRGLGYWAGWEGDTFVGWWSASSVGSDPHRAGQGEVVYEIADRSGLE